MTLLLNWKTKSPINIKFWLHSNTKERIALIQRFISIFGKDRIVNVFADREFIGEKRFTWLIENDINFCIRVKKKIGRTHV